jgi:hypothetical protein
VLERRRPLEDGLDAGTDLLERELESGVKIQPAWWPSDHASPDDCVDVGLEGLVFTEENIVTRERRSVRREE